MCQVGPDSVEEQPEKFSEKLPAEHAQTGTPFIGDKEAERGTKLIKNLSLLQKCTCSNMSGLGNREPMQLSAMARVLHMEVAAQSSQRVH